MDEVGGVRDHLANERTHLAWLRTGATTMVVGLAVARFADEGEPSPVSLLAGGLLLAAGAVTVGYGTLRYRRLAAQLQEGRSDIATSSVGPVVLSLALVVVTLAAALLVLLAA